MSQTEYPRPNVTADMLIPNERGEILLIQRGNPPFQGACALPGGFLEVNQETVEQCALREALEETGLRVEIERLIGVYSDPARDPRWHTVTAAYLAKPVPMETSRQAIAGDDANAVVWIDPHSAEFDSLPIAFDHRAIIRDALG
ncbi:MAG: NUDIX domain-containing protein [bacterium]|nr:NUDIX domain-containing protein [bacterium]